MSFWPISVRSGTASSARRSNAAGSGQPRRRRARRPGSRRPRRRARRGSCRRPPVASERPADRVLSRLRAQGTGGYPYRGWQRSPRTPRSGYCSPRRADTAPASIAPCRRSSARSTCTARPSTCARRSSTTNTSSSSSRSAARSSSRRSPRFRREARRVLGPRCGAQRARELGRPPAADDRRDLPARHQGARRGAEVRGAGVHDRPHRARGPRGSRGDHRRGARQHRPRADGRRRRRPRAAGPEPGRVHHPDHAVGGRDHGDHRAPEGEVPGDRGSEDRRHLLRDDQPPVGGEGVGAAVRPGARDRLHELVELESPRRGRAASTAHGPI